MVVGCASHEGDDEESSDDELVEGTRSWDDVAEREFSDWVAKIGTARAAGRCTKLNACMNDASINPLKSPGDENLNLVADCADVPMELRGYFAVKTKRAFKYVTGIRGTGNDLRYSKDNQPTSWATSAGSSTMQRLMSRIAGNTHSGFLRMAPEVENNDTYPIKPSRASLRPGSVYYDPAGHVLIVYRVDEDGTIWTIDGHPDNSLTYGRFTEGAYQLGARAQGGGFRNFRPQRVTGRTITFASNAELSDFGDTQYGHGTGYFDWLTSQISGGPGPTVDRKMSDKLDQLCIDIQTRIASVDVGRHLANGPLGEKPPNIYGAEGDWENFSTPSRDARLRAAFRGVYKLVDEALKNAPADERAPLAAKLGEAWRAHQSSASCTIRYRNSRNADVTLTLEDVQARIYDLSFDPYHCVEMRWGAHPSDSEEMRTCTNATPAHFARFDEERRNRNVIDRENVPVTGPDYGPDVPADIDVKSLLQRNGAL